MTFELLPLIGIEGIVIFSLILLVSIALTGFRLSIVGTSRLLDGEQPKEGRLRVRQRLATRLAAPAPKPERRSRMRDAAQVAGWIFAAARNGSAKSLANQSKIVRRHAALTGVKVFSGAGPIHGVDELVLFEESCAGVAENEPQRMDSEAQWTKVNKIVAEGLGKAKEIESLHEAAARQLDAVDYAYERMLLELRDVLPGVVETRSVCRSNRDADYAAVGAVEKAESESAASESEISAQASKQPENIPSPASKAAPNSGRAPDLETAESAAA